MKVPCPKCGRMIEQVALKRHLDFLCPHKDDPDPTPDNGAVAVMEKPKEQAVPVEAIEQAEEVVKKAPPEIASTDYEEKLVVETKEHETPTAAPVKKNALFFPKVDPDFYIDPSHLRSLNRWAKMSDQGDILNILLLGERGTGKTTMGRQFAAMNKKLFYEEHCGAITDVEHWMGKDRLKSGETVYRASMFVQAISTPGTVVLLDELNRAHPEVLNAIFGLLDWRRSMWSDDLQMLVEVAEGVVFFGTMNEGDDYIGTNDLDSALRERFKRALKLVPPPSSVEEKILTRRGMKKDKAKLMVAFAEQIRKATDPIHVSPRQLATVADEMRLGATLKEAVEVALVNTLTDQQAATTLEALQWIEDNPYVADEDDQDSIDLQKELSGRSH